MGKCNAITAKNTKCKKHTKKRFCYIHSKKEQKKESIFGKMVKKNMVIPFRLSSPNMTEQELWDELLNVITVHGTKIEIMNNDDILQFYDNFEF